MQTIGIIDIVWQGRRLPVEKGATIQPGGMRNNAVLYGRGVARSQENVASMIKCTTLLPKGMRYDDLVRMDEGELVCVADTGNIFTFPAAFLVNRPEINDAGKFSLEWQAGEYEETIAS